VDLQRGVGWFDDRDTADEFGFDFEPQPGSVPEGGSTALVVRDEARAGEPAAPAHHGDPIFTDMAMRYGLVFGYQPENAAFIARLLQDGEPGDLPPVYEQAGVGADLARREREFKRYVAEAASLVDQAVVLAAGPTPLQSSRWRRLWRRYVWPGWDEKEDL
jgi:hypothetical protein